MAAAATTAAPSRERPVVDAALFVSTAELRADDEAGIALLHAQLQRDVEAGIDTLRECRERDPYRQFPARAAWEAVNGVQAPSS